MSPDQPPRVEFIGLRGLPLVKPGDDLAALIVEAAERNGTPIKGGDIVVISQVIVSKAEGAIFKLSEIKASPEAEAIAHQVGKPPEVVEVILREKRSIVRLMGRHFITETKHGWVCANSGVDMSNVSGGDSVTTLPLDSDASARKIRSGVLKLRGMDVAVIVVDTFGRPLRKGQVNVAIGVSGLKPILDRRGDRDLFGYVLKVKETAVADEIASGAELVLGEGDEGIPVALVRGYPYKRSEKAVAKELIRLRDEDIFF